MNIDLKKNLPIIIFIAIVFLPLLAKKEGLVFFMILAIIYFIYKYKKLNKNINMENNPIDINNIKFMKNVKKIVPMAVIFFFLIWLFTASIVVIEAGETGVYSLFGKVKDEELSSGFHLVIPLAKVTVMSIRTEEYTMSIATYEGKKVGSDAITALTKEGLSVDLDMTVLYRLDEKKASDVYRTLGLAYEEKIIRPAIRTSIRDVIAQYEAKDVYSEKRQEAKTKIMNDLKEGLEERGIIIEDVLLRNVNLPQNLANSIQEKLQAEQEAEKYDFLLETEKKEKERVIIEAEGQRDAQKIINESLSTNYLYYLYINDLKSRAGTIYVPTNPETGMPLFRELGN